ncbi:MAG: hypothetical protein HC821_03540, partial [Lewinella sp.]|nr:hypothetical protein [Lewinella sp.]
RHQLLNSVLLIDAGQKARGEYYEVFVDLRRQLFSAEVLWKEGFPKAAYTVMLRILNKAIKLEMSQIVIDVLPHLRNYTINYSRNQSLLGKFLKLFEEWIVVYQAEMEIRSLYDQTANHYVFFIFSKVFDTEEVRSQIEKHD